MYVMFFLIIFLYIKLNENSNIKIRSQELFLRVSSPEQNSQTQQLILSIIPKCGVMTGFFLFS